MMLSVVQNQEQERTVNGVSTGQIWSNGNVIAEYVTRGTKSYIRGAGGEIVKTKDRANNNRYLSYNAHGDITNIIEKNAESTSFAVTAAYEYDAFGGLVSGTGGGEADSNGFRYNGQYTDEETGLIYLLNRYYDPSIGGFTQEDPYWNPTNMIYGDQQFEDGEVKIPDYHAIVQSANLYVYCANDSVNGVDPTGMVAGERFSSADYAAEDWSWNYFAIVDYTLYEQMSIIYEVSNGSDKYYTYGYASYNQRDASPHFVYYEDVLANGVEIPDGYSATPIAFVHAQANISYPSNYDYSLVRDNNLKAFYTVTYAGDNKYNLDKDYLSGDDFDYYRVGTNTYNYLSSQRKWELYNKFHDKWEWHIANYCDLACELKVWPRTRGEDW